MGCGHRAYCEFGREGGEGVGGWQAGLSSLECAQPTDGKRKLNEDASSGFSFPEVFNH